MVTLFKLPLKTVVAVDAPVHGKCHQTAFTLGVANVGVEVFVSHVEAVAKISPLAKAPTQISGHQSVVTRAVAERDITDGFI